MNENIFEKIVKELEYQQTLLKQKGELLSIHRNNLAEAQKSAARHGVMNTPRDLQNEIEIEQDTIKNLKIEMENIETRIIKLRGKKEEEQGNNSRPSIPAISTMAKHASQPTFKVIPLEESIDDTSRSLQQEILSPPRQISANRRNSKNRIYVIAASILLITIINIWFVWPRVSTALVVTEILDQGFHHLGDNTYNQEYIDTINGDKINELNPEGVLFSIPLNVENIRTKAQIPSSAQLVRAELLISVNHVKPRQDAPVAVFLNDTFQAFINDYVSKEQFKREIIAIELNTHDILPEENTLIITSGIDENQGDYEDFEFNDLGITLTFNKKHTNWIAVIIIVIIEVIIIFLSLKLHTLKLVVFSINKSIMNNHD